MNRVLIELANQVREHTLLLVNEVSGDWQFWSPPGTQNHFLWHAGHILWGQDLITLQALGYKSEFPEQWREIFGHDCHPVSETKAWPKIEELRILLQEQHKRIICALASADEALLGQSEPSGATSWPPLAGILHAFHDEARHQGEMYLLLKMTQTRER